MTVTYEEKTASGSKNRDQFFIASGINRFGERLKAAMDAKGITSNVKMGEKCGMSDTVIRNYLIGKTYPTLDRLSVLAYELDCSPTWLLCGADIQVEGGEHKTEATNKSNSLDEPSVLQMLSQAQAKVIAGAILEHGVSGIMSALNGMAAIDKFMQIPEKDRERVMRLYSQLKEGDSEGDQQPASSDPVIKQRQAS